MNTNQYQLKAARTLPHLTSMLMDDLHMVLGMQTEVAEIADVYKKNIAYGKPLDEINVKEELGDVLWYIANMCNLHGWSMEDVMDVNIKKLETRYPEKFTEELALNRNLDAERDVLEGNGVRTLTTHVREAVFTQGDTTPTK